MANIDSIIKDLTSIFSKAQQKNVNIEYSSYRGGEVVLNASESVFKILDNENSKLFNKFTDIIDKYELCYDFQGYGTIVIYEE